MPDELSVRQWQEKFRAGAFNAQDRYTQCEAGWYDWFCQDHALAGRLKKIGKVVMGITDPFILELLPTVLYIPDSFDPHWFNGENVKRTRSGYRLKIASVDQRTEESYLKLVHTLSIQTFCRIDARVRCSYDKFSGADHPELAFDDIYFVEINVMPTIRDNNNFAFSYEAIQQGDKFFPCITTLKESLEEANVYNFLLTNSMMSFL